MTCLEPKYMVLTTPVRGGNMEGLFMMWSLEVQVIYNIPPKALDALEMPGTYLYTYVLKYNTY